MKQFFLVIASLLVLPGVSIALVATVGADGYSLTLTRSGNTFQGTLELVDGELGTSWRDYIDFKVEVADNNDTNGDGLPDIIYVPEPASMVQFLVIFSALAVLTHLRRYEGV